MQVSNKVFTQQSIESFADLTNQIQKKQEQVATGKGLVDPSDDPVLAARVMVVGDQLGQTEQFIRNIDLSYVKLSLTETALEQVSNLTTRSYELALQAASDSNSDGRQSIAIEIEGLLNNILDIANSSDSSGRAIFGGFKVGEKPFETDSEGNVDYTGDRGVHEVKISNAMRLQTTLDGATVFERVPNSAGGVTTIFDTLKTMVTELKAGNGSTMPIDDLRKAAAHFADQRAWVGAEMNKADNQRGVLENRQMALTENIGEMEDADLAKIVTDLQMLLLNKETAQKTFARISQLSLFDLIA